MKTKILYFSGTGNTFSAAWQLHNKIENSSLEKLTLDLTYIEGDRIILLAPTYAYGLPDIVIRFLKRIKIKTTYLVFLTTCGTSPGGIFFQVSKLLRRQSILLSYYQAIPTVENYFALFKRISNTEEAMLLENQSKRVDEILLDINNGLVSKKPKRKVIGLMINSIFRIALPIINSLIKIDDDCTSCETCIKNCPSNAIYIKKKRAFINKRRCQNCQGCINRCPFNAITFLRIKKKSKKYVNPNSPSV